MWELGFGEALIPSSEVRVLAFIVILGLLVFKAIIIQRSGLYQGNQYTIKLSLLIKMQPFFLNNHSQCCKLFLISRVHKYMILTIFASVLIAMEERIFGDHYSPFTVTTFFLNICISFFIFQCDSFKPSQTKTHSFSHHCQQMQYLTDKINGIRRC